MSQTIASPAVVFTGTAAPLALAVADAKRHVSGLDAAVTAKQASQANNFKASAASLRNSLVGGVTAGLSGAASYAIGEVVGGGLKEIGASSVKAAADIESLRTAFDTMLGSGEKADAMLGELRSFAAESPLGFADASAGAKRLLAMGVAADQIVPSLRAVADVSSASAGPGGMKPVFDRVLLAYGQVNSANRATGEEIKQFTEAGVQIEQALAAAMGRRVEDIRQLASEGKVGKAEIVAAFKAMTEGQGRFAGMSEKYSQTTAGAFDKLGDAYETLKAEFGRALIDELDLKGATRDLDKFLARLKSGVNELRPAIRFAGEVVRAAAQIGNELGKAAVQFGTQLVDGLVQSVPGLKEGADSIKKIIADAANFEIDPATVGKAVKWIGGALANVIGSVADWIASLKTEAEGFLAPFTKVADRFEKMAAWHDRLQARSLGGNVVSGLDSTAGAVIGVAPSETEYFKRITGAGAVPAPVQEPAFPAAPPVDFSKFAAGPAAPIDFKNMLMPGQSPPAAPKFEAQILTPAPTVPAPFDPSKLRSPAEASAAATRELEAKFAPRSLPESPKAEREKTAGERAKDAFAASVDKAVAALVDSRKSVKDGEKLHDLAGPDPLKTLGPLSLALGGMSQGFAGVALSAGQAAMAQKGLAVEVKTLTADMLKMADQLTKEYGQSNDALGARKLAEITRLEHLGAIDKVTRDGAQAALLESVAKRLPEFKPAPNADYGSTEAAKLVQEAMGGRSESAEATLRSILEFLKSSAAENAQKAEEYRKAVQTIAGEAAASAGRTPIRIR